MNAHADGTPTSSSWLGNSGGWYPRQHSKGESLEEEDVWLLIAYSPHGSWELHEVGLLEHRHLSTVSMAWLARSVWSFDCGWNPEDKLTVVPMSMQKAFQNLAINSIRNNISGYAVKSDYVID